MSGPRRSTGETVPFEREELAKLTRQTENHVPVIKPPPAPGTAAPNANVVAGRRGNSAHSLIKPPPPPPPGEEAEGESEEVIIEMSGDDDEDDSAAAVSAPPRRSRSDTLADPMTTSMLAQAARDAPAPPPTNPAVGPNRNVKRRVP